MDVTVYTDGACASSTRKGGWGAVVLVVTDAGEKFVSVLRGDAIETTNNRMELLAVIRALAACPVGVPVTVILDSQLTLRSALREQRRKANLDLWSLYDIEAEKRTVSFVWVRGHQGNHWNEIADHLAGMKPLPVGWSKEYTLVRPWTADFAELFA